MFGKIPDFAKRRIGRFVRAVEALPSQEVAPRFFDGSNSPTIFAKVTGSFVNQANPFRYVYTVKVVQWSDAAQNFVETGEQIANVFNTVEWYNESIGGTGGTPGHNGNNVRFPIQYAAQAGRFTMSPANIGEPIVLLNRTCTDEEGINRYCFTLENGVDKPDQNCFNL